MTSEVMQALESIAAAIDRHADVMERLPAAMTDSIRDGLFGENTARDVGIFDATAEIERLMGKMYENGLG